MKPIRGNRGSKVVVGLSGGLDSAVALLLLKKQGYQPVGLTLKYNCWAEREKYYSNQQSVRLAQKVCQRLKTAHYTLDCRREFRKKIIGYSISLLKDGKTPNPCVICNQRFKFEKLMNFAKKKGINCIATGHYARIRKIKDEYQLLKGRDKQKDQSYFLCLLDQKQLAKTIFPLGDLTKKEVYRLAKKEGLDFLTGKKESQDLCFIAQKSRPLFLEKEIGRQPGQILDKKGKILGWHQGLHFYTIGQRKGIRLPGGPWRVLGFNRKKNQLIVTNQENDPALYQKEILLSDVHFISKRAPVRPIQIKAKIRFNQKLARVTFYPTKSKLVFDKAQKAVSPGQWAVFYDGPVCLGGGMIKGVPRRASLSF